MADSLFFLSPALVLLIGGLILSMTRSWLAQALYVLVPGIVLAIVILGVQSYPPITWLNLSLIPQQYSDLGQTFAITFAGLFFLSAIYALRQVSKVEKIATFLYAGSSLGAVYAGDWISLFLFWELMAIAATIIVWSHLNEPSYRAGFRYLIFHLLGGAILLAGIAAEITITRQTQISHISLSSFGGWLILFGLLISAGAFPFGSWVTDAYPEASWSGTVFLSLFTTKVAIYFILRSFAGTELLIWVGLATALHGLIYALLQIELRRFLSYILLSQIGIMLCGIGLGTDSALRGVIVQALASMVYMTLLFMASGMLLEAKKNNRRIHSRLLAIAFFVGGIALAAVPGTIGFVSKSTLIEAVSIAWPLGGHFLMALSMGTAIAIYGMFEFLWKIGISQPQGANRFALSASSILLALSFIIIGFGIYPPGFSFLGLTSITFSAYTAHHFLQQAEILGGAAIGFSLIRLVPPNIFRGSPYDVDYLWRHVGIGLINIMAHRIERIRHALIRFFIEVYRGIDVNLHRYFGPKDLSQGPLTDSMGRWAVALLGLYFLLIYVAHKI